MYIFGTRGASGWICFLKDAKTAVASQKSVFWAITHQSAWCIRHKHILQICLNFSTFSTDPEESRPKDFFFISVIDRRLGVVVIVGTPWDVGGSLLEPSMAVWRSTRIQSRYTSHSWHGQQVDIQQVASVSTLDSESSRRLRAEGWRSEASLTLRYFTG